MVKTLHQCPKKWKKEGGVLKRKERKEKNRSSTSTFPLRYYIQMCPMKACLSVVNENLCSDDTFTQSCLT